MQKEVKDRINKRKIAYIYLLHRMFESNPAMMLRIMRIPDVTVADIQDWDLDYKDAVYKTIQEEDMRGVTLRDPDNDVPSIKSIKEKVLRRVDQIIAETTDPARLATTYKVLSEFEIADDKKEKSVLDAINESIKPLTVKKKKGATMTMLDKMKYQKQNTVGDRKSEAELEAEQETETEIETEE